jgi:hypothetical protein
MKLIIEPETYLAIFRLELVPALLGQKYIGTLTWGDRTVQYAVEFTIPFWEFGGNLATPENMDELKAKFPFTIQRAGQEVAWDDSAHPMFFKVILNLAFSAYHHSENTGPKLYGEQDPTGPIVMGFALYIQESFEEKLHKIFGE